MLRSQTVHVGVADQHEDIATRESFHSRQKPLQEELQTLSDLCVHIRLSATFIQAAVLSDSIQRTIVSSIRRKLQSNPPGISISSVISTSPISRSFNPSALNAEYDDRYVTRLAIRLLRHCCLNAETESGILPLSAVLDTVLQYLHTEAHIDVAYAALKSIWADVFSILTDHLSRWLDHGVIQDPNSQFFISVEETHGASHLSVNASNLPNFFTKDMADMIIFTGTSSKCANLLAAPTASPRTLSATALSIDLTPTILKIQQYPSSTPLILEAACESWRALAAEHMSRNLPFKSIATRIRHLRDFLLQGNASFWRCVFDDMRTNPHLKLCAGTLTEEARQVAERSLNRLMSSVAVDTQLDDDSPDYQENSMPSSSRTASPLILQIAHDGTVSPQFSLSLAETQVLADGASVYCDAFAVTFGLRRTSCELRAAFTYLLSLERAIRYQGQLNSDSDTRLDKSHRFNRRRESTRDLVTATELRRRMMIFIEYVEWYIQATVIQPKFDKLLSTLDNYSSLMSPPPRSSQPNFRTASGNSNSAEVSNLNTGRSLPPVRPSKPFFDEFKETNNKLMEDLFKECFVADDPINNRLNTIFDICITFSQFLRDATPVSVQDNLFASRVASMDQELSRNVDLFRQMLLVYSENGEAQVARLLLQLNYTDNGET